MRCVLPQAGTFTVLATDASAVKTGSYNLYLQRLTGPVRTRVIVAEEPLDGAIIAPIEADTFRWSAGASDRLRVTVTTITGDLRPTVRIFDPAGTTVCEEISAFRTSVEIADCLLPRSGVYSIVVGDGATRTGTYRIGLTCLSSPCGAADTAIIGPEGGQMTAGELQIAIPPGAFAAPTTIQITPQVSTNSPSAGVRRVVRSFAILAFGPGNATVMTAALPLTYTLRYATLDLATQGIVERDLRLAFWNDQEQHWTPASAGSDGASLSATSALITNVALVTIATDQRQLVYLPLIRR